MNDPAFVRIRPAVRGDVPAILAIYNDAVATSTASWDVEPVGLEERLARFDAQAAAGLPLLVADADGAVLGYATFGPFRPKAGYARTMEHSVYLAPDARGLGLGRRLMVELIAAAREAGVHALVGALDATNVVSLRLHAQLGFVEVGRLPQVGAKFGRWLDLVFVQLLLDADPHP